MGRDMGRLDEKEYVKEVRRTHNIPSSYRVIYPLYIPRGIKEGTKYTFETEDGYEALTVYKIVKLGHRLYVAGN